MISQKQKKILAFPYSSYDALICDGAAKNIIVPYISMHYAKSRYTLRWRRSDKILEVTRGAVKNYFEVFGGKDESSYALIQGRTLAGVLLDEVPLRKYDF